MIDGDVFPGAMIKVMGTAQVYDDKSGRYLQVIVAIITAWSKKRYNGDTLEMTAVIADGSSAMISVDVQSVRKHWRLLINSEV